MGEKGGISRSRTPGVARIAGGGVLAFRESPHQRLWPEDLPDGETLAQANEETWQTWMEFCPPVPDELAPTARAAWSLLGALQVEPAGQIGRTALLCSKNSWLTRVYSWDNCFYALALAHVDP